MLDAQLGEPREDRALADTGHRSQGINDKLALLLGWKLGRDAHLGLLTQEHEKLGRALLGGAQHPGVDLGRPTRGDAWRLSRARHRHTETEKYQDSRDQDPLETAHRLLLQVTKPDTLADNSGFFSE